MGGADPRRALVAATAASLVVVASALSGSIVGTNRSESLRGTSGPDRISARDGDDKLFGLAGDDVLTGGPGQDVLRGGRGSDRLLLRDGSRDVAACGPGRDTVLADGADVVLGDCETMRVLPPEPQSPPPRPVVPGVYGGRTTQGELVTFQVDSGGALSRLAFPGDSALSALPPVQSVRRMGAGLRRGGLRRRARRDVHSRGIGSPGRSRGSSHVPNRRLRALDGRDRDGSVQLDVALEAAGDDVHLHRPPTSRWTAAAAAPS